MELEGYNTSHRRPQVDRHEGYRAWLCLAGCFFFNVLVWGFAFSFGILQSYYTEHEPFNRHPEGIAAVGTTATGLMYLLMPVYFAILQRWPRLKRYFVWASLPTIAMGLIGASFASTVPQLIVCQGVLYALGGNMMFAPSFTYLDEWFIRRKGLAIGIMWAGDGTGGIVLPLVLQALLSRYGFRATLRAVAVAMVLMLAPLSIFFKPRLPIPAESAPRPIDTGFLQTPLFWALQAFNIAQGMGYFLPSNNLPSYAQSLGLSAELGSLTLIMVNVASALGCVLVGTLCDRFDVLNVLVILSVGATTAILAVWGLASSATPLFVFSLFYGLTAGAYSCSWGGMAKDIRRQSITADTNIVFSFLAAGRGIGAVISGPLSEALTRSQVGNATRVRFAYDSDYRSLVIFAGCTAMAGGCSWLVRRAGFI
ncbi:hypothetical protein BAUCODRAFT_118942 [Baudoinia panamericana UAMH 10762]|uniref:Major facilitator superfamily (MFS) profile domain-containing protein n=1 Tax=Baudoinia panamericana (strain UAMH 10762) TaxID=717646 RepID=M2MW74_BAUPA|nr:uncharacterized protein BAUCODRAFT_118942 [Baudoinia panamericana UAMH 10762]EMD01237.1 hypothetical protein BAUCODRAFT_118942 [Baudoinia panamericana UAMH 10762]